MPESFPYKLPKLAYGFSELEPFLSSAIMQVHYAKHHAAYVNNLNQVMEKDLEAQKRGDLAERLVLEPLIRFYAGGHLNHSLFWENLAPPKAGGGGTPTGELARLIDKEFGSFPALVKKMSEVSVAIQGSGWGWLVWSRERGRLIVTSCANQDYVGTFDLVPLLCIDVWEHAYYLQYQSARAEYVKNSWEIINWATVQQRLTNNFVC